MQYTALPRDKGPGVLVLAKARWTIGMGAITRVLCVRKEKEGEYGRDGRDLQRLKVPEGNRTKSRN
jgi:hypothetical protein